MIIGILADTHDQLSRTKFAVRCLLDAGAKALFHCGDLSSPEIVAACCELPFYFTFGNHDADSVPHLQKAALEFGAKCLGWGGEIQIASKRIALVHGHLTFDLKPLLKAEPDYLFSGHSHIAGDWMEGKTRRINPGALHRADEYSVALLNLTNDELRYLKIPKAE